MVRTTDASEKYRAPDSGNWVDGVPHPPFIRQKPWSELRHDWADHMHRPGDVWVTTFPKCGTTFMEQIVLLLLNGGDADLLTNINQNDYDPTTGRGKVWAEQRVRVTPDTASATAPIGDPSHKKKSPPMSTADFASMPAPRVLKTHAPRQMFLDVQPFSPPPAAATGRPDPLAAGTKVIYVSRSAADACVSAYYHAANPHRLGFPFGAWAYLWLVGGLFEHGRWSDHVAGWRAEAARSPEQVLWVRYEDLKADPAREVRRVADFVGVEADAALVERVVVGSGFESMRARAGPMAGFYRQGKVGDAARHMQPSLRAEFDAALAEQMRGCDDPYAGCYLG